MPIFINGIQQSDLPDAIVVDPGAPAGSIDIDSVGKTTLLSLKVDKDLAAAATSSPTLDSSHQILVAGHSTTGDTVSIGFKTNSSTNQVGAAITVIDAGSGGSNDMAFFTHGLERFRILDGGGFLWPVIKSGTDQGDAGAAADEPWRDTSDGNALRLGV